MSASGHKWTSRRVRTMSALLLKADIRYRVIQFIATAVSRRTAATISATSLAIFGPCVLISVSSVSEIRSHSPDLKLGHSLAAAKASTAVALLTCKSFCGV
jgi:hypothetical protein